MAAHHSALRPRLAGAGTALLIAVASILASPSADPAAAKTSAAPADFLLKKSENNALIDDLDAVLPNVSIADVVADGNRDASRCSPPASNLKTAFCWNSGDNKTLEWYPQGVTTTADADPSGSYGGVTSVAVSWYSKATDGINRGVRVSFVDWSDPSSPTYRHVLLVEPVSEGGQPSFQAVQVHAGGIVWNGPYLYVADTWNGFRVFDLRHLWRVTATGDKTKIGRQPDGTYQAHNYKYVLPQVFSYQHSTTGGQKELRFSFAGMDRTSNPASIIAGEYQYPGVDSRVVRFPFGSSGLLAESGDGYVHATESHELGLVSMQGALAIDGKFYISSSDGDSNQGDLATFTPGASPIWYHDHLPAGCEDLSYWAGRDQLWSAAEYPGNRSVYAVAASAY